MHKSRLGVVVIDCHEGDLATHAQFWSKALGYDIGESDEDNRYIDLEGPDGELRVILQQVDHDPRIHLDIESDDREAEAARLVALGAKEVARIKGWIVLEAPSGHRFCVVKPQRSDFENGAKRWDVP